MIHRDGVLHDRARQIEVGRTLMIMHEEAGVLEEMHHTFIPGHSFEMVGKHHEIYFSDLRKTAPERLRTLLRQPVRKRRTPRPHSPRPSGYEAEP